MSFDLKDHLKTLVSLHAPSGYEAPVRDHLREIWGALVDEFQQDGLGSLIAIKQGEGAAPRPKIMLAAHMDEIALMVSEVREGYLRLADTSNGIDDRTLQAKSVIVHGKRPLIGTIAAVPPHISASTGDGRNHYPVLAQLWVDLGLSAEEVADLVSVGDLVTLDAPLIELKGDVLASKAMDNRASIAAVSYALHLLQKRRHDWDVYAVATVQEENLLGGARVSAQKLQPDLAIALDVTFAKQHGVNGDNSPIVGKGITFSIGPNFHPPFTDYLKKLAKELEIPFIIEPSTGYMGTDAWTIQTTHQGIPTALISLPLRNMHTPIETLSLTDIKRAGRLLAEIITALDADTLPNLAWKIPSKDETDDSNGEDA